MPSLKNLLLYTIAVIAVAFVITRIPGYTLDVMSHDHDKDHPIQMGTNVWPGYEPFYLARNSGFVDESTVNLLDFTSATQVDRSYINGTIDAATLTLEKVLILRSADVDVVVPLVIDFSSGGDAIVARPGIDSMQALEGRVIAAPNTTLGALMLNRALELNQMSPDAVQVVFADLNEHVALYERGEVDAIITYSPILERLKSMGMREVFTSREIPGQIIDVLAVTPHLVEEHPDKLQELLVGWFDALNFIEAEPERAGNLMATRLSVPGEEALASLENLQLVDLDMNLDYLSGDSPRLEEAARSLEKFMIDGGLLDEPVDMSGLFSDRVLLEITRQRAGN